MSLISCLRLVVLLCTDPIPALLHAYSDTLQWKHVNNVMLFAHEHLQQIQETIFSKYIFTQPSFKLL